jgi:type II secretion system protein N
MRLFKRRLLWYLLFGAFLLLALFWWTFPSEQVQRATVRTLEELLPGKVTVESVRLSFPFHLVMKNITFESGPLLIQLPDTRLVPDLMGFLRGRMAFKISDFGKAPRLRGEYRMEGGRGEVRLRLENLELKTLYQKEFPFRTKASGEAVFQWVGENPEQQNGEAWLLLEKGKMENEGPAAPFLLTFINKVRTEFQVQKGVFRVTRLEVNGKEFGGGVPPGGLSDLAALFPSLSR